MMLTTEPFSCFLAVRHGFFTREGGVSEGLYASLNCGLGSDDDPDAVRANRGRAMDALGLPAAALATVRQVHSARALVVDRPWADDARPEAELVDVNRRRGGRDVVEHRRVERVAFDERLD